MGIIVKNVQEIFPDIMDIKVNSMGIKYLIEKSYKYANENNLEYKQIVPVLNMGFYIIFEEK